MEGVSNAMSPVRAVRSTAITVLCADTRVLPLLEEDYVHALHNTRRLQKDRAALATQIA